MVQIKNSSALAIWFYTVVTYNIYISQEGMCVYICIIKLGKKRNWSRTIVPYQRWAQIPIMQNRKSLFPTHKVYKKFLGGFPPG